MFDWRRASWINRCILSTRAIVGTPWQVPIPSRSLAVRPWKVTKPNRKGYFSLPFPPLNFRGELLNFRGFSTHGQILWSQIYANDKHPQWSAWIHCFLLLACLPATCPDRTTQSWQPFVVPSCRPGRVLNGPGGWGTSSPRDKRKSNEDIRRKTPRGLRRQLQTFGHLKFLGHQKSSKLRFVNLESTKSPKSAVYGATFDEPTS